MHQHVRMLVSLIIICTFSAPSTHASGAETRCGTSGIRGTLDTHAPALRKNSGGKTFVCNDGSLLAVGNALFPQNEWWRVMSRSTWKNPLVAVCILPLERTSQNPEDWYNIIGVHTPYQHDERNYVASYRYDGQLIIKKEITTYTNLSAYYRVYPSISLNTPIGMVVARTTDSQGDTTIRTWIQHGNCTVDTTTPPQLTGHDTTGPQIRSGLTAIRTDFLFHKILEWRVCESSTDDQPTCVGAKEVLVPVPR